MTSAAAEDGRTEDATIRPFTIDVPESDPDDLRRRVAVRAAFRSLS